MYFYVPLYVICSDFNTKLLILNQIYLKNHNRSLFLVKMKCLSTYFCGSSVFILAILQIFGYVGRIDWITHTARRASAYGSISVPGAGEGLERRPVPATSGEQCDTGLNVSVLPIWPVRRPVMMRSEIGKAARLFVFRLGSSDLHVILQWVQRSPLFPTHAGWCVRHN